MNLRKHLEYSYDKILWICLLLVVLDALLLAFYRLQLRPIWLDEAYSILISMKGARGIVDALGTDTAPPLHFILLGFWLKLFPSSEFSARALSGVLYLISLVFVFLSGRKYGGNQAAVLCTTLFALSRLAVRHAVSARMYSLLALLSIVSTYLFIRYFFDNPKKRGGILLYVIVNILGTFTHYWFFFILFSHLVVCLVLLRQSIRKFLVASAISGLPFLIFWTPIFLTQSRNASMAWFQSPSLWAGIPKTILDFYAGWWFVILICAVISVRYGQLRDRSESADCSGAKDEEKAPRCPAARTALRDFFTSKPCSIYLLIFAASSVTPLLVSEFKPIYEVSRQTVVLLFPFMMVAGLFLARFGHAWINVLLCYLLVFIMGIYCCWTRNIPEKHSDKVTAQYLIDNAERGDIIVFTSLSKTAIQYYLTLNGRADDFVLISFPSEIDRHPGFRDMKKMTADLDRYEKEAGEFNDKLVEMAGGKRRLWLFYGVDMEISSFLKKRMDNTFELSRQMDMPGLFHTKIFLYLPKNNGIQLSP